MLLRLLVCLHASVALSSGADAAPVDPGLAEQCGAGAGDVRRGAGGDGAPRVATPATPVHAETEDASAHSYLLQRSGNYRHRSDLAAHVHAAGADARLQVGRSSIIADDTTWIAAALLSIGLMAVASLTVCKGPGDTKLALACLVTFFTLMGAGNIIVKDFMAVVKVPRSALEGTIPTGFDYPTIWNMVSTLGMSFFVPLHMCSSQEKAPKLEVTPKGPQRLLLHCFVLAMLLYASNLAANIPYRVLPGSLISMIRSSKVLFTALLSYLIMGRKMTASQAVGLALVMAGVIIAGLSAVDAEAQAEENGFNLGAMEGKVSVWTLWGNIGLVFVAEFLRSALFVYQELLMKEYSVSPVQLCGAVGSMGLVFGVLWVVLCEVFNIEDIKGGFYQLAHSHLLIVSLMAFLFTSTMFEFLGVFLTKRVHASWRAVLELLRVVIVWVVEVALQWNAFTCSQAIGFAILIVGCLVNSKIIPLEKCIYQIYEDEDEDEGPNVVRSQASFIGTDSLPVCKGMASPPPGSPLPGSPAPSSPTASERRPAIGGAAQQLLAAFAGRAEKSSSPEEKRGS
mmetsp:Transcript_71349/g.183937  ORF Transcript_71349/g.183937 Transcript_71349/m.183937 type:complete len:567 (+) Transcript_71349:223-1923(+)